MTNEDNSVTDTSFREGEQSLGTIVTIFTEVTPERAQKILSGKLESVTPPKHNLTRWYAEAVLDRYQDVDLKAKRISRWQKLFASPIPYQGHAPLQGKVLIALEVNPELLYIAEADHITAMWTGDIETFFMLKDIFGDTEGGITRTQFEDRFNNLPEDTREHLLSRSKEQAEAYWSSVIPYQAYMAQKEQYYEPEILMVPEAEIISAQRYK